MKAKVIGGGLAGCEASYQLLKRGISVTLYEMRPAVFTGAHKTSGLAELVCSNSLKSIDPGTPQGLLKSELKSLDSLILKAAIIAKVPSGTALSVDRESFSHEVEKVLKSFPNFKLIREEVTEIDNYSIVATGPLSSSAMCDAIKGLTGREFLNFYDAISPIVEADSVDMNMAFFASRYGKGDADYLNCGMTKEDYIKFRNALLSGEKVVLREFESKDVFEGCIPIEELARRGEDTMRYGPLRPVGLVDEDGKRYYAVVQLRKEDLLSEMYNMVGFQTNMKYKEQERIFRLIPALSKAEFVRLGSMHKNIYIESPRVLEASLRLKKNHTVFFAGQITGVEGYMESAAMGLLAGINMARLLHNMDPLVFSKKTMIGALSNYVANEPSTFRPMNANIGLLEGLESINKNIRKEQAFKNSTNEIKKILSTLV
ncbi:MAG: methylenetetrahydrofolate--tRNA-(uracil(54)-C(5))-methyltransferase (FADH(2)-oxidizing) TrmFO [Clostridiales bacterium]|jgi:methylenetetrahydrofolate--tRNA-(uracil-5-)-methyltransferase|nr:methylenetetrahydrofolate--tRNA-(uracil(54)-C(5))-methyltransferase (FADH(2)-oxidizing) TrmFO [Clostridiales bacterium]